MRELVAALVVVLVVWMLAEGIYDMATYEGVGRPMDGCADYWRYDRERAGWCAEVLGIPAETEEPARAPAQRGAPASGLHATRYLLAPDASWGQSLKAETLEM